MSQPKLTIDANPVVRFRLRALLIATTVAAVLAAIGGAYLRCLPTQVQGPLLVYWLCLAALSAIGLWHHWRTGWRLPETMGDPHFVLWSAGANGASFWQRPSGAIFTAVLWLALIGAQSVGITNRLPRMSQIDWFGDAVFPGCFHGLMSAGAIVAFLRRPVFLTDIGVWSANGGGPWRYIRHAEWLRNQPAVMKLRRLDGDIIIEVPVRMRTEVEAFVRDKTSFIDAVPPALATTLNKNSPP